jgi:hypothetical protein
MTDTKFNISIPIPLAVRRPTFHTFPMTNTLEPTPPTDKENDDESLDSIPATLRERSRLDDAGGSTISHYPCQRTLELYELVDRGSKMYREITDFTAV